MIGKSDLVILISKYFLCRKYYSDEKNGPPPEVNLSNERNNGLSVLKLINGKSVVIKSVHDVYLQEGLIVLHVTEMSIKASQYGLNNK